MSAQSQVLEVTTEQMQRMMDQAKKRARLGFIAELDAKADVIQADAPAAATILRAYAEELRGEIIKPVPKRTPLTITPPPAVVSGGERDPLDTADEVVAEQERGGVLPEVQHLNDEVEGLALVKNLGARGRLNIPRD